LNEALPPPLSLPPPQAASPIVAASTAAAISGAVMFSRLKSPSSWSKSLHANTGGITHPAKILYPRKGICSPAFDGVAGQRQV
jgi:hypothetical protein